MEIKTKLTELVGLVLHRLADGGFDSTWSFVMDVTKPDCRDDGPWAYQFSDTLYIDEGSGRITVNFDGNEVAYFDYDGDGLKCVRFKNGPWVEQIKSIHDKMLLVDFDWADAAAEHDKSVSEMLAGFAPSGG